MSKFSFNIPFFSNRKKESTNSNKQEKTKILLYTKQTKKSGVHNPNATLIEAIPVMGAIQVLPSGKEITIKPIFFTSESKVQA